MIFLVRVGRRENSLKEQLIKKEDVLDVMDLSTVLSSVTPLIAFSKYLDREKHHYSHLLRFIKMAQILEELVHELSQITESIVLLEVEILAQKD